MDAILEIAAKSASQSVCYTKIKCPGHWGARIIPCQFNANKTTRRAGEPWGMVRQAKPCLFFTDQELRVYVYSVLGMGVAIFHQRMMHLAH